MDAEVPSSLCTSLDRVLGCIRKVCKQLGNKPISSIPPWFLLPFLLEYLPWLGSINQINYFLPWVAFDQNIYHSHKEQTRTETATSSGVVAVTDMTMLGFFFFFKIVNVFGTLSWKGCWVLRVSLGVLVGVWKMRMMREGREWKLGLWHFRGEQVLCQGHSCEIFKFKVRHDGAHL